MIRAAGGAIYAVTSEPQALATCAETEWGFGFPSIGDPHHEISGTCAERGWLGLFVNTKIGRLQGSAEREPEQPKGFFQPGVLALGPEGRVLYRWRSVPSRKNLGGAAERPTASHVWSRVRRALDEPPAAGDAPLDASPSTHIRAIPWPLFVGLLLANGWFLRPRVFNLGDGAPSPQRRLLRAALRLPLFLAGWAAAFWLLPPLWVGLALALWVAWIAPGIRAVHEEFQNVRQA